MDQVSFFVAALSCIIWMLITEKVTSRKRTTKTLETTSPQTSFTTPTGVRVNSLEFLFHPHKIRPHHPPMPRKPIPSIKMSHPIPRCRWRIRHFCRLKTRLPVPLEFTPGQQMAVHHHKAQIQSHQIQILEVLPAILESLKSRITTRVTKRTRIFPISTKSPHPMTTYRTMFRVRGTIVNYNGTTSPNPRELSKI